MPLVAAHFVNDIGMTAALVGLALALRQMCQQGLTFIGGMLADRYGLKPVLCTGLIIRAGGFFLLGYAQSHGLFFLALLMTGIGGALFGAPRRTPPILFGRQLPHQSETFAKPQSHASGLHALWGFQEKWHYVPKFYPFTLIKQPISGCLPPFQAAIGAISLNLLAAFNKFKHITFNTICPLTFSKPK